MRKPVDSIRCLANAGGAVWARSDRADSSRSPTRRGVAHARFLPGTVAAIACALLLLPTTNVRADPDQVYVDGFERVDCSVTAGMPRQESGLVYFGNIPGVHFNQPLEKWGDLWGFRYTCSPDGNGTCEDVADFPNELGSQPVLLANTSQFVALRFTAAGAIAIGMTSGSFKPSPSAGDDDTQVRMSISDRCGDFDPNGPFLSSHPKCIKNVAVKNTFLWTTEPSPWSCSLRGADGQLDPDKTWYVNMKVDRCAGLDGPWLPPQCLINILHQ
jgi:hypothetical protein